MSNNNMQLRLISTKLTSLFRIYNNLDTSAQDVQNNKIPFQKKTERKKDFGKHEYIALAEAINISL